MGFLTASNIHIQEVIRQSGGGTYDDVESIVVPEGYILEMRHVAIENRTTNYTRLLIGIKRGSTFKQHEAEESPVADQIYWSKSRLHVPKGYTFCARMVGCTLADILVMTLDGMLYKVGDESCRR